MTRTWMVIGLGLACGCAPSEIVPPSEDSGLDAARPIDAGRGDASGGACDEDHDGRRAATCGGDDCDDTDSNRFPGNSEVCDTAHHDEDCDPATFGVRDADRDGAPDASCCDGPVCGTDCNDTRADVHPGEAESCDGIDQDCDGSIDEELTSVPYFADCDGDMFGTGTATAPMCARPPGAPPTCGSVTTGRWSDAGGDCDDTSASSSPSGTEACDQIDNDCDSLVDEGVSTNLWPDADGDGYGLAGSTPTPGCPGLVPMTATRPGDCNDAAFGVNPAAIEICDGVDDNCDGAFRADEDVDHDGYPGCGGTDCNDAVATIHPGAPEVCNHTDDNCNGTSDETFECVSGATGSCTNACGATGSRYCAPSTCTYGACNDPQIVYQGNSPLLSHQCGAASTCCGGTPTWCVPAGTAGCYAVYGPYATHVTAGSHIVQFYPCMASAGSADITFDVHDADSNTVLATRRVTLTSMGCGGIGMSYTTTASCHRLEFRMYVNSTNTSVCLREMY